MLVFENNNYIVVVGESQVLEDAQTYLVKNKMTDVVEAEDPMLPRAVDYAMQLDETTSQLMHDEEMFPDSVSH